MRDDPHLLILPSLLTIQLIFLDRAGFPPFSGGTPDETWSNLKNWQKVLTRPVYTNPKDLIFNMSDEAWDAITRCVSLCCLCFLLLIVNWSDSVTTSFCRLIAHEKVRTCAISDLETLPFFSGMKFKSLRETQAPFVPSLENEVDVGYYDDFSNEADLAKYGAFSRAFTPSGDYRPLVLTLHGLQTSVTGEVFEKQRNVDAVQEKDEGFNRGVWCVTTRFRPSPITS